MCDPASPSTSARAAITEDVEIPLGEGDTLPAVLSSKSRDAAPGIVLLPDVFGPSPFYDDVAGRLAAEGFHTLTLDYFGRVGPLAERTREAAFARRKQLDDRQTLDDIEVALGWLRSRPLVAGRRLGTLGFCLAGTFALNLAARRRDVATVCYYGFPAPSPNRGRVAAPSPLDEVQEMAGPIIGFWGNEDKAVDLDGVRRFQILLEERGVDAHVQMYEGVGHNFLADGLYAPEGAAAEAAADSFDRMLAFYRRHLHDDARGGKR